MKKNSLLIIASFTILLSACAPGLDAGGNHSSTGKEGGQGGGSGSQSDWSKVEFVGKANGGDLDGKLVAFIDKATQTLNFVLPLPTTASLVPRADVTGLPGAFISVVKQGASEVLAVTIPLKHLLAGQIQGAKDRLPNGDSLPFVKGGELPRFAMNFPGLSGNQIHVYLSEGVAAVFAELPDFGMPFGGTVPISNKELTKTLGAIGYLPPKGQFAGGMYLAAQLPSDVKKALEDLLR